MQAMDALQKDVVGIVGAGVLNDLAVDGQGVEEHTEQLGGQVGLASGQLQASANLSFGMTLIAGQEAVAA